MDKRTSVANGIYGQGVLPLYFHSSSEISLKVLRALYEAGIRCVEYTNRGKEALENFKILRACCDKELTGMALGVGTIKDASSAEKFTEQGADFLVSPGFSEDVFDVAYSNKLLWIPGCMTPTEIIHAEGFGISLVKIFPGNILGPSFLNAIRDIFPGMGFMPTGGVEPVVSNLQAWFQAGAKAVGIGSKLISNSLLEKEDFAGITSQTRLLLQLISGVRNEEKEA